MKKTKERIISVVSVVALFVSLFMVIPPAQAQEVRAVSEVTIVGTIVNTRDYYNVDGAVCAYAFIPATLTTVSVGGKNVDLTVCGAGTMPALGTNDLSGLVGVTRAYTGSVGKINTAPFKYSFGISSYADTPAPDYVSIMKAHLEGLGYINVVAYSDVPGEVFAQADTTDFRGNFYFFMHNGVWGEISAVVTNADHTGSELEYGCQIPASGGFAKAQKVATIFAQYNSGAITKDAAQKSLNSLQ